MMYLAGHKQPATTARYMRPQRHAAEEVLRAAAAFIRPRPMPGRPVAGVAVQRWDTPPVPAPADDR
jgi:hypothetical protein